MVELRDYQTDAVNRGVAWLKQRNAAGLLILPTGSGKSLVIAGICRRLGAPTLILQPSKELLDQNYAKLRQYGIDDIGIYSASKKSKQIARYTYATIGSIERRPEEFKHFRYVIIDEAHNIAPGGRYERFLAAIGSPAVIGLTATPYRHETFQRTDHEGKNWSMTYLRTLTARGQFFDEVITNVPITGLMDAGFLARPAYRAVTTSALHPRLVPNGNGTEFTDKSVSAYWHDAAMEKLAWWLTNANFPHKRVLVFCPSLEVATKMSQAVNGSTVVDGTMKPKDRDDRLAAFAAGECRIIFNVGVLTTGYDLPSLDAVILMRPTMSLALYMQMVGRVLRIDPHNPAAVKVVYDAAGNFDRFGRAENVQLRDGVVYVRGQHYSGMKLGEVCLTDIAARRKARAAA